MTPTTLMLIGAGSGALALAALLFNFFALAGSRSDGGTRFCLILHVLFGLWAAASWVTFLVGLVMFLIDYAKHG